jgi:predicted transcriptional regulator
MFRKVTISLPDGLLDDIDAEALATGTTRSGIVQEASAHYIAHARDERSAGERRAEADDLVGWLSELAARPSADLRPSLEILREVRAESAGGPDGATST